MQFQRSSRVKASAPSRLVALLLALALTACAGGPPPERPGPTLPVIETPEPVEPEPEPEREVIRDPVTPPHLAGQQIRRIALLLPFTAANEDLRNEAAALQRAAEMALFERGARDILLIPKDTAGSEIVAEEAAIAAVREGADLIMGPLTGVASRAAAAVARRARTLMLSFADDAALAGGGVYLLTFLPEDEIARLIDYSAATLELRYPDWPEDAPPPEEPLEPFPLAFAYFGPDSAYGQRVLNALAGRIALYGAIIAETGLYPQSGEGMREAARFMAHVAERNCAVAAWEEEGGVGDPALDPEFDFELPYQAVILPEGGTRLRELAPLLPFYDVDPRVTQFLGTGLWLDPALAREPALNGGWFPGPDPRRRAAFEAAYETAYGAAPSRLASLGYDGIHMAAGLFEAATGGPVRRSTIETPLGFYGADGLIRFGSDGLPERGLAILQVRRGSFRVIDPAPTSFEAPEPPETGPAASFN